MIFSPARLASGVFHPLMSLSDWLMSFSPVSRTPLGLRCFHLLLSICSCSADKVCDLYFLDVGFFLFFFKMQASFELSELEAVALHFQQSIDGDLLPDSMEMRELEFDQVSVSASLCEFVIFVA